MTAGWRVCAALLVLALIGACSTADPAASPQPVPTDSSISPSDGITGLTPARGGSLRYGLSHEPRAIIPGLRATRPDLAVDSEDLVAVDTLFDSLTAVGEDLDVVPAAARDWEVTDDGTTITFRLRSDGLFHDGSPVTAQDFVRSWNRIADGTGQDISPIAYRLAPVVGFDESQADGRPLAGLEAVDDHTLRVGLDAPFYDFPMVAAHPALGPLPATVDAPGFADEPVGNGPFEMAEPWQHEQFVRVIRFEDHPQPPLLTEIVFRIFSGTEAEVTAYDEFRDGRLHVAPLPPIRLDEAVRTYGRSADPYRGPGVVDGESLTLYYYGFNVSQPPFDDPDVRAALSLLIDREAITDEIMAGTRSVATSVVAPPVPGHRPGTCGLCRYAPQEAAELLEGKGLERIPLLYNEHPAHDAIARRFKQDVEAATDVVIELEPVPFQTLRRRVQQGDIGLFRLGWVADLPTMDEFLTPLFSTQARTDTNVVGYSDETVDGLLAEARSTADLRRRQGLYAQAEDRIMADLPLAPIMFFRLSRIVDDRVRDVWLSPTGIPNLEEAWLVATP